MFELLSEATAIGAALCWLIPAGALVLMFVGIVIMGVPEPPKDGGK